MDFKKYLQESALEINKELEEILEKYKLQAVNEDQRLENLVQVGIDSSKGGKRIRAVLIKLGYEIAKNGQDLNPEINKAATSIELFQAGILAHDDIIDQSPIRRGEPSVYMKLGGDHHAISQAICIGDIGMFLAFQSLSETNFPAEDKNRAIDLFSKMATHTVFGEMLDVELPTLRGEKTEEDVLKIHRLKTAFYTLVYPLKIGAVLGGASNQLLENFEKFGEALGIAYQIQDDILGIFGSEQEIGKSITSDIEEGKNTLLIIEALKNANDEQNQILNNYYGKGKIGKDEQKEIQKVFTETGSLEYSQTKALDYVNKAKELIPEITTNQKYQNIIEQMANFLVERSK
jgi:geranylgeranyl diphosphate synthase type I